MALSPATLRLDLKCGRGAISKGEKCHKGPATTVAVGAAAVGVAAGVGALLLARKRHLQTRNSPSTPGQGMELLAEGTRGKVWLSADKKTVTKVAKDSQAAKDLFEEARLQSKAHKAGVSTPKVVSTDAKRQTITMENLQGYKPIRTGAKDATPAQKATYARDLVVNLSKAHAADIAHGDLNTNVLVRDGKLAIIDWGQASKVRYKGMADILNAIRIADDLNPDLAKTMKQAFKPLQAKFSKQQTLTVADFNSYYSRVLGDRRRVDSARLDLKCGRGAISPGEKCHKGPTSKPNAVTKTLLTAGAIGLGMGLAKAVSRRPMGRVTAGSPPPRVTPVQVTVLPPSPPRLRGSSPKGLLPPSPPRQSKTARMRANTGAAMRVAEQRVAQTAREEVRRIGQIGNTMAAVGEATGMATKTTLRELRLRTEAARRRFEPSYRRSPAFRPPAQLPEGGTSAFQPPAAQLNPLSPEAISIDPRTGQPRRRRAQGFGRQDACWAGYVQAGMKRKGKRKVPNCIPAAKRDTWAAGFDADDGKKYSKTVTNPKTGRKNKIRYGAKGYKIAPGTDKGDRYCARSFGDMKSHGKDCSGPDRNTPLCLSRAKWKCSGKTSRRGDVALTPGKSSAW